MQCLIGRDLVELKSWKIRGWVISEGYDVVVNEEEASTGKDVE